MQSLLYPPVLVIAVGSYGDLFPYLRLAQEFAARGHEVNFVASSYHRTLVEQAGLRFFGLGNDDDYLRILRNPDLWNARKGFALLASFYPELLGEILATVTRVLQSDDSWVFCHPLALPAAAILREQKRVAKIASAYLAPSNLPSCYGRMQLEDVVIPSWVGVRGRKWLWHFIEKRYIDRVAVAKINQVRQAHQLEPIHSYFQHMLTTPNAALCLFPAWFGELQADWPSNLIQGDFPLFDGSGRTELSAELKDFLASGEAPLVFTQGTGHLHAKDYFQAAATVLKKRGWRGIFLSKDAQQIPRDLPDSILWQTYVPLTQLLPHAALLSHHGGIGTSAEAMRAGVPQLVTPYAWDQFDNGGRLQEMGVARSIAAKKLTTRTMEAAIVQLLNQAEVSLRCQQVAAHFATSLSAAVMCERLSVALQGASTQA